VVLKANLCKNIYFNSIVFFNKNLYGLNYQKSL
jgi:hypothetical protein